MEISTTNINEIIDSLQKEAKSGGLGSIGEIMSASEINSIAHAIEERLDALYEKTRLLEELDNFTREYAIKQITEKEALFKERFKIIEDVSNSYKDTSSVSVLVPFVPSNDVITDRDGTELPKMLIKDGGLEAAGTILSRAQINDVKIKSNRTPYNNSYRNLVNGKLGTSYYIEDATVKDGIKEECTVTLKRHAKINSIDIEPINCTLSDCRIINENGIDEKIDSFSSFASDRTILGIKFTLTARNYSSKFFRADSDAYSSVMRLNQSPDASYYRMEDSQTIRAMEKGISAHNAEYDVSELKKNCHAWQKDTAKINTKNAVLGEKNEQ